jgi:hypothetical protein
MRRRVGPDTLDRVGVDASATPTSCTAGMEGQLEPTSACRTGTGAQTLGAGARYDAARAHKVGARDGLRHEEGHVLTPAEPVATATWRR